MEIIYLLIPLSLILVGVMVWIFVWAIQSDQFDDLEGPVHQILMDDDSPVIGPADDTKNSRNDNKQDVT